MSYIPQALRDEVASRANSRCEYCHLHKDDAYFSHEIDHIFAEKHGGETTNDNLCLACSDCNRNKGSDICSLDPQTGEVTLLFHPRKDGWHEHFELLETGVIQPKTANGRATVRLLKINNLIQIAERARLHKLRRY